MSALGFLADVEAVPEHLTMLADSLDRDPFAGVPIAAARSVLLTGMGSSWFAARTAAGWLRSVGVPAVDEPASLGTGSPGGPGTVALLISNGGRSVETLDRVSQLAPGTFRVAMTEDPSSPLAQACDLTVTLGCGPEDGAVASRSYRHTLALLLALGGQRAEVQTALRAAADHTVRLLADRGWVLQLDAVLGTDTPSYWLAPADRLGSALQGALMQRECPRLASSGCETGDWSHVDVYLTATTDYRAVLFAGSRWDGPALDWMRQRGSTVVYVGDPARRPADFPFAATVELPADPWAAMLAEPVVAELLAQRRWSDTPPVLRSAQHAE